MIFTKMIHYRRPKVIYNDVMHILIIGDVYGSVGQRAVDQVLPKLKALIELDFVVMNVENLTNGKSICHKDYEWTQKLQIDCLTSGNHIFWHKDAIELLNANTNLLRPDNYVDECPGHGSKTFVCKSKTIRVTNLIGQNLMHESVNNPFSTFEKILTTCDPNEIHLVDFHAETTSEKMGFARYFDGRFTAFYGTHTHVQTADERWLPKNTAFITDIGMTGAYESIIGVFEDGPITRMKKSMPARFIQADGDFQFCAWILKIDDNTNQVIDMQRIFITPQRQNIMIFDQPLTINYEG